jgi:hypothetical protein
VTVEACDASQAITEQIQTTHGGANPMSRKVLTLIASLAVLAVSATAAFAASPH